MRAVHPAVDPAVHPADHPAAQPAGPIQRPMLALGLRLLAVLVLSTLYMLVKYTADTGVRFPEILFWRQAPSVVLILGWLMWRINR